LALFSFQPPLMPPPAIPDSMLVPAGTDAASTGKVACPEEGAARLTLEQAWNAVLAIAQSAGIAITTLMLTRVAVSDRATATASVAASFVSNQVAMSPIGP
jgi:hypothetical protein